MKLHVSVGPCAQCHLTFWGRVTVPTREGSAVLLWTLNPVVATPPRAPGRGATACGLRGCWAAGLLDGWAAGQRRPSPTLVAVGHLFAASAGQPTGLGALLQELCLAPFQAEMEAVGTTLWCDWDKTIE